MAPSLGNEALSAPFAGAIAIYFSILGFLLGWLATRLYLGKAMRDADAARLLAEAQVAASQGRTDRAKELGEAAVRTATSSDARTDVWGELLRNVWSSTADVAAAAAEAGKKAEADAAAEAEAEAQRKAEAEAATAAEAEARRKAEEGGGG